MTEDVQGKKRRVLFVLPALTAGGAERVLITLMNALDRDRFEPVFLTVSDEGPLRDLIDEDIPFHSLKGRRVLFSPLGIFGKLIEIKPDVVISTMTHMNFMLLLLRPFFPKTRFIVREAITPSFILGEHPRLAFALRFAYKLLYPLANSVVSPAQVIIDEFRDHLGMSCGNHALLYNPVDFERIRAAEDQSFEMTEVRKKTLHFVAAGRLHHQKGFDRLIEALSRMEMPYDWRLTIFGEGKERPALERLIEENGLADQVSLPGLSDHPWPHYAEADCFLLPSRWEGLPNVVLEALACGTPVIATAESGGISEIAALASEGDVRVVSDMTAFLEEMKKVKPNPAERFRPSLLPDDFSKSKIVERFSRIL